MLTALLRDSRLFKLDRLRFGKILLVAVVVFVLLEVALEDEEEEEVGLDELRSISMSIVSRSTQGVVIDSGDSQRSIVAAVAVADSFSVLFKGPFIRSLFIIRFSSSLLLLLVLESLLLLLSKGNEESWKISESSKVPNPVSEIEDGGLGRGFNVSNVSKVSNVSRGPSVSKGSNPSRPSRFPKSPRDPRGSRDSMSPIVEEIEDEEKEDVQTELDLGGRVKLQGSAEAPLALLPA